MTRSVSTRSHNMAYRRRGFGTTPTTADTSMVTTRSIERERLEVGKVSTCGTEGYVALCIERRS